MDCKGKIIKQIGMICKKTFVTGNGKYAVVRSTIAKNPTSTLTEAEEHGDCSGRIREGGHQEVALMDSGGNVLWNTEIPADRQVIGGFKDISGIILSDNAEVAVFKTEKADGGGMSISMCITMKVKKYLSYRKKSRIRFGKHMNLKYLPMGNI